MVTWTILEIPKSATTQWSNSSIRKFGGFRSWGRFGVERSGSAMFNSGLRVWGLRFALEGSRVSGVGGFWGPGFGIRGAGFRVKSGWGLKFGFWGSGFRA